VRSAQRPTSSTPVSSSTNAADAAQFV